LDGLRGLTALVVLLDHVLVSSSSQIADSYSQWSDRGHGLGWVVSYTPLHIFHAGQEAVVVFFVLSGFVLTRQMTVRTRRSISYYYPQRLLRLYLPVWGVLLLALALRVVVDRERRRASPGVRCGGEDADLALCAMGWITVVQPHLVHVPVIVTLAFALGGHPSVPMQSALGIPVALLVAEAFYRVVERPSHQLARRAGAAVDAQWQSRPRPRTASAG